MQEKANKEHQEAWTETNQVSIRREQVTGYRGQGKARGHRFGCEAQSAPAGTLLTRREQVTSYRGQGKATGHRPEATGCDAKLKVVARVLIGFPSAGHQARNLASS